MKFSRSYALALGAALLATPARPASLAPNTYDPRATAQSQLGVLVLPAPVAERLDGALTRVYAAPSAPATPLRADVVAFAPPAVPALPATPCPPAVPMPAQAPRAFDAQHEQYDADAAQELARTNYAPGTGELYAVGTAQEADELAAERQARARAEAARASAVELETHAVELQKHAIEMEQRAYAEQGRARARAESEAARANAEAAREALDAVRGGALGRTSWRASTERNASADRSLEERVARLEALANERFPGRDRADPGSRSLEARVAELEELLLGGARTPAPRARTTTPGPSAPERARARVATPDVYSYDAQRGTLRKLPSGAEDRTFRRAPASGGGGSSFAPRARQDRERATPAPAHETDPAPALGETRDEQRAEVERRMIELREQLAKLREQMNGMRAELEALPRRDD